MDGVASFKPFIIIIIITITIILIGPCIVAEANDDTKETHPPPPPPIPRPDEDNGGIATTSPTVSPSHSRHRHGKKTEPLKPSTVIVVCVLTTLFSITFILLLYIKHCIAGDTFTLSNRNSLQSSSEERKNSGVDRAVVESLPIFRFGSLRGQKEGLDCAVCLARFEDSEVLRLLPKCNHAFHVECVDTWLHAHSTCPLCRHNIDPEDITLVERQQVPPPTRHATNNHNEALDIIIIQRETNTTQPGLRNRNQRVSGRHSSEGEFLRNTETTSSFRRSSFDSASSRKMKGMRKDGMLLLKRDKERDMMTSEEHRLEHRIIVSPTKSQCGGVHQQRWSNVEPSDLLYLTSEMIISDSPSSSSLSLAQQHQSMRLPLLWNTRGGRRSVRNRNVDDEMENGGMVNLRSVSEATGMSRFLRNGNRNRGREGDEQRHEGAVTRWLAWISVTVRPR